MTDLTGKTLGQYQILREIGRGGMAVVYEAYQPSLGRTVAIKVLPPEFTHDKSFIQRFLHEARASARLEHPNIVAIHDVLQQGGYYFIVMQKLEGESLHNLIQKAGRLPPERASYILTQVAAALDYAHAHNIVHRDIKPANIIVGPGDHATLTDFGIAKAAEGTKMTQTGTMMGTPEYMSPEQAKGEPAGPASDIYALGLVTYQMLTGRVPFQANSTPSLLYKHVHESVPPLRQFAPDLPPGIEGVVAKALAKEPAQRFHTAAEFAATLKSVGRFTAYNPAQTQLAPKGAPPVVAPARKLPSWAIIAAAAAVVVLFLAIFLATTAGNGRPTPSPATTPVAESAETAAPTAPTRSTQQGPETEVATAAPGTAQAQVISDQDVSVYAGPGPAYGKVGLLKANEVKKLLGRTSDGDWLQICCVNGDPVWVAANLVQVQGDIAKVPIVVASGPTATPQPPTSTLVPRATATRPPTKAPARIASLTVVGNSVNVRSGPGTNYARIGAAGRGQNYRITGRSPDRSWWQIEFQGGAGWINAGAQYVQAQGDLDQVQVVVAPPTPTTAAGGGGGGGGGACRAKDSLPGVSLRSPRSDLTCSGPVLFSWDWAQGLQSGEVFELHIWADNAGQPQVRNAVKRVSGNSVVVDINKEVPWIRWDIRPHRWEVVVVCKADGRWVSQKSEARLFYFEPNMPPGSDPNANCK
ncbi:MAG: protein kinase [Caldilineales bacterium]|nr:protein kinase [Caldilineales bacterium]